MKRKLLRAVLSALGVVFLGLPLAPTAAPAATLYERSREMLAVKAEKALPAEYTFVVLGDSRDNDGVFRKTLALARGFSPLFILHTGDYSSGGTAAESEHFLALLREEVPDIPCFVVLGNHERPSVFEKVIGPRHFTLDLPRLGLRLVAVDNAGNALETSELGYLRDQLKTRRPATFVTMHVPPRTNRWSWHSFTDGAENLTQLLAEDHVSMAFFGHVHIYDRAEIRGIPCIITGGAGAPLTAIGFPGEAVHHLTVVRVKDGRVSATMVPLGR